MKKQKTTKLLMTPKEIHDKIIFEDSCKVNTLLQNLIHCQENKIEVNVFHEIDNSGKVLGYRILDKKTNKDVQL